MFYSKVAFTSSGISGHIKPNSFSVTIPLLQIQRKLENTIWQNFEYCSHIEHSEHQTYPLKPLLFVNVLIFISKGHGSKAIEYLFLHFSYATVLKSHCTFCCSLTIHIYSEEKLIMHSVISGQYETYNPDGNVPFLVPWLMGIMARVSVCQIIQKVFWT